MEISTISFGEIFSQNVCNRVHLSLDSEPKLSHLEYRLTLVRLNWNYMSGFREVSFSFPANLRKQNNYRADFYSKQNNIGDESKTKTLRK